MSDEIKKHLDHIYKQLKSKKAAVLVGAGFSKNANLGFPDGAELIREFYTKLPCSDIQCENLLTMAQEVEKQFGRPRLDDIIHNSIPDNDHSPSALHKKLLSLPWTDIFTTNFDTLLERAGKTFPSKHFETIARGEDLIGSAGITRIVKLHGSLPKGPFTITQQDYKEYREKFALFVNTIQQALIEKTLCVIGFSGDDNNFRNWTKWLHNILESPKIVPQKKPKIYFLIYKNIEEIPEEIRREWDSRNITPLQISGYGGNRRSCYEALLDHLLELSTPATVQEWLNLQTITVGSRHKRSGCALMHFAAKDGRLDVLEWLQDRGEDISAGDRQ